MSAEEVPSEAVYIDERELSKRLGVARVTLSLWRRNASGPPWYRLGARRVVYKWPEVEAWVEASRVGAEVSR